MDIDYKDKNRLKYPHFVYSYEKYLDSKAYWDLNKNTLLDILVKKNYNLNF